MSLYKAETSLLEETRKFWHWVDKFLSWVFRGAFLELDRLIAQVSSPYMRIKWNERPKSCRNIVSPFPACWLNIVVFWSSTSLLLCQWYSPQGTLWKHPFEHVWTLFVCLTHKSPFDNLHGSGYSRHVDKLTSRCSFKALVGAGVFS